MAPNISLQNLVSSAHDKKESYVNDVKEHRLKMMEAGEKIKGV